jgi:hypothetical protein
VVSGVLRHMKIRHPDVLLTDDTIWLIAEQGDQLHALEEGMSREEREIVKRRKVYTAKNIFWSVWLECYSGRAYDSVCWGHGFEVGLLIFFDFYVVYCN